MSWFLPGAGTGDRSELLDDWRINQALPGIHHPHLPSILRDLGRYRLMSEDERNNWKVRVERAFGGSKEYLPLGGTLRNIQERILSHPLHYPRAATNEELLSVYDKANRVVDTTKLVQILLGGLPLSPGSALANISASVGENYYRALALAYDREIQRRGLVADDLPTRRFP